MRIRTGGFCEKGLCREVNQDRFFVASEEKRAIAAIADGIGGFENSEQASMTVCDLTRIWWSEHKSRFETEGLKEMTESVEKVLMSANRIIVEDHMNMGPCGSTAVILIVEERKWALLFAGDSRCYQIQKCLWNLRVRQITTDDVWESQEGIKKHFTKKQIRNHPYYGRLIRAVGTEKIFTCGMQTGEIKDDTLFFLCSDGVYRYCEKHIIRDTYRRILKKEAMENCLEKIRKDVYRHGAPDNLSSAVIHLYDV